MWSSGVSARPSTMLAASTSSAAALRAMPLGCPVDPDVNLSSAASIGARARRSLLKETTRDSAPTVTGTGTPLIVADVVTKQVGSTPRRIAFNSADRYLGGISATVAESDRSARYVGTNAA